MRKYKAASWIIAAVLVGGAGVALAETVTEGPTLSGDESGEVITPEEGTGEEGGEIVDGGEDGTTDGGEIVSTPEDGTTDDGGDGTEDGEGAHGEHGALVSAAAHDHSFDEAC